MVNRKRLIKPQDDFKRDFPELDFRNVYHFHTSGEQILVTDPIHLADVYNSQDDVASFLRARGVFVGDFGGDSSGPVWWQSPFIVIPISLHYGEEPKPASDVEILATEIRTDSGSFIFLLLNDDLPQLLKKEVKQVLSDNNGASLKLPSGKWSVFYEQWDAKKGWPAAHFRNIVLKWQAK